MVQDRPSSSPAAPATKAPEHTVRMIEPASAAAPSYLTKDHWHAAYGMYVCDHFLPPVTDAKEDVLGIHTHGEGVIHIHPFSAAASGDN